jgi:acyl-CoA dehydrogenase family protein 9
MSAKPNTPHLADPDKNPSFTRGVFQGEILEDLVFPFPEPSAEEKETLTQILDSFRSWAADTVDSAQMDHDGRFSDEVRKGMAELGLMGLNIPEEYGGFGASSMVFSRIFGEVGAVDAALAVYFGAHQSIGIKGIILFGTDDQKQRWLPRCASGELIGAFCLTEPGSGSDAQAMLATAVPSADGKTYTLNGTKMWISNAGYAGVLTVFAKVPVVVDGKPKQRVTAFIVDAKAPGVSLGKIEEKMGIKASDTRTINFENVQVPAEDRLGEVGSGFKIALEILNSGRLGLAAGSSRGTREMMKKSIEYIKQRQQFGRPIGDFEMLQRKVALAAADCYASDAGWMLCAGMVDRGGVDFSLETAACKVYASELAWRTASDTMQMAGGIGYSKEFHYERAVRDSRINMIFEGTNEILRALIALMGLQQPGEELKQVGKAFRNPLKNLGVISSYVTGRAKRTLTKNHFTKVHEEMADEADEVATNVHNLALAVEKALIEHGKDIIERQMIQERMANAAIDIYLSTAVLSRVTSAIQKHGVDGAKDDIDAARIFIPMSMRRTRRAIRAIEKNSDERLRALAKRAYDTGDLTVPTPTDV